MPKVWQRVLCTYTRQRAAAQPLKRNPLPSRRTRGGGVRRKRAHPIVVQPLQPVGQMMLRKLLVCATLVSAYAGATGCSSHADSSGVASGGEAINTSDRPPPGGKPRPAQLRNPDYGFWDPGLVTATARTAYDAQDMGTRANPIVPTACLYPDTTDPILINGEACGNVHTLPPFANANAWTNAPSWPLKDFWVVQMNDEGAFDACNSGPPDASVQRSSPGNGMMGLTLLDTGESLTRSHLVLNYTFNGPCEQAAPFTRIPFLSFGAHKSRGNGKPIAAIHPSPGVPSHVSFTLKLWDISSNATPMASELWTVSSWGGITRMIFIAVGRSNLSFGHVHRHWNWPIAQSFLAPGADIAYYDSEELEARCPGAMTATRDGRAVSTSLFSTDDHATNLGRDVSYDLDLEALYGCASADGSFDAPAPSTADIPVDGVFWSNEIAGRGSPSWLWTSVHGMDVH